MPDELCSICGEPRSAHVPTEAGPLTHPREAAGEGRWVMASPGYVQGGFMPGDGLEVPPSWRFVPSGGGGG